MPITEGTTVDQAPAAPAPAPIDYSKIGAAVADSLRASGLTNQPLNQTQTVSAFQEAIRAIESNPDNDRESLSTLSKLFEAQKADLSKENEVRVNNMIIGERVRQATQLLDAEIARVIEADETLAGLAPAVKVLATQEFDNDSTYDADRKKLIAGQLDPAVVRKLVSKKFSELRPKQESKGGLTGVTTQGTSPATAAASAEPAVGKVEDLNERQKELYYSIVHEQSRIGFKALGKTQTEVEAEAFKRASAKFRT